MKPVALETDPGERAGEAGGKSPETGSKRRGKNSVSIELGGKEYRLRSDADEERLQQVASYVDSSMQKVRDRTGMVDSLDIALLAALNLAREVLQLRESTRGAPESGIDPGRLRDLIELVETEIGAAASQGSQSRL